MKNTNSRRYRCEVYIDVIVDDKDGYVNSDKKIQTVIGDYVFGMSGKIKDELGNEGKISGAYVGDVVDLPFGDMTGGRKIW